MVPRLSLLVCVGKALVRHGGNALGLGLLGDVVVDVGEEVWKEWNRTADALQRRTELQALARAAGQECRDEVEAVVREVAAELPLQARQEMERLLLQVPAVLRRQPELAPRSAADMIALFSSRPARQRHCLRGHRGPVHAVALAADGRLALSGGEDGTARLWDVAAGRELRCLDGGTGAVRGVAFSPDGRLTLTGGEDGTVLLWHVESGRPLAMTRGHRSPVRGVAFAPDGQWVLICGGRLGDDRRLADGAVVWWDLGGGPAPQRLTGSDTPILAAIPVRGGTQVLTGGWDHRLRLWGAESGSLLRDLPRQEGPVWSVAVDAQGRRAVSGGTDGVHVWDLTRGSERRRFEGHADWVLAVALSADGLCVLSGGEDGTTRLWDADTTAEYCRCTGHTAGVTAVALSRDGRRAVTASKDGTVRVWEIPAARHGFSRPPLAGAGD
jgi:WD40 repeat protein